MAYSAILGASQQLAIANSGRQTQINLTISSPGQQQSQSSSFSTGKWTDEPKLFQVGQGFVLVIQAEANSSYISIQHNAIAIVQSSPDLNNCPQVALNPIPDPVLEPMQPMQPMQPLKMGNMSMDLNSMSMQMGNMSLNLNNQPKTTDTKQFCSQCGTEAKTSDRFCRSCGHKLDQ
ncbi:MAG: zinc ribbon domain-containing protein [Cyanobacteria bacterium J06631_2]